MKMPVKALCIPYCKIAASAASLLLLGNLFAYPGYPAAEAASDDAPGLVAAKANAATAPAWSKAADPVEAVVSGDRVYYYSGSELIAADAATGKTLWTYAGSSTSPVLTLNHSVFIAAKTGKIVKLNADNGKVLWSKNAPGRQDGSTENYMPNSFLLYGSTLYLSDSEGLTKIKASSGQVVRNLPDVQGALIDIRGDQLFGVTFESGAYTQSILKAYDEKTGRMLWEVVGDHSEILGYRGGYMYTREIPLGIDNGYAAVIDKVDLKTGKTAERFDYLPVEFLDRSSAHSIVMSGSSFYILQNGDNRNKIQRIRVDAPSGSQPDFVYKLNEAIDHFSVSGTSIAALMTNDTSVVWNRQTGEIQTTTSTPAETSFYSPAWLTVDTEKAIVQTDDRLYSIRFTK